MSDSSRPGARRSPRRPRPVRAGRLGTVGAVAAGLLLCLGLANCGGEDESGEATEDKTDDTASVVSDRVAPDELPEVPALKKAKGAVGDVEVGDCTVEAGEQTVTGTITSSRKKPRDYVVTISWVNDKSDVRGRAVVVEKAVEPGESREFEVTGEVAEGATQCVPNVRAGKLKRD